MRRQNKRIAKDTEKCRIERAIKFQKKFDQCLAGFHYTDELANQDGIHLGLLVPENATKESIDKALSIGYGSFDVVSHSVIVCPEDWLS